MVEIAVSRENGKNTGWEREGIWTRGQKVKLKINKSECRRHKLDEMAHGIAREWFEKIFVIGGKIWTEAKR